jgi:charged multivesicular body protein 5
MKIRDQMKKQQLRQQSTSSGTSSEQLKKKALVILKQKKMYEHQREQLYNQQFNVDSVQFATENAKATVDTVRAMKEASKVLKVQFKQKEFDIDAIDALNDQMQDLLDYNEEVQECLGQSYQTPDDIDEDGLMDELNMLELDLEDDFLLEDNGQEQQQMIPSYLRDDPLPQAPAEKPFNERGLPAPPAKNEASDVVANQQPPPPIAQSIAEKV